MSKPKAKKNDRKCLKCGKPGASHFVATGDKSMKGPYHEGCKP